MRKNNQSYPHAQFAGIQSDSDAQQKYGFSFVPDLQWGENTMCMEDRFFLSKIAHAKKAAAKAVNPLQKRIEEARK